MRVIIMPEAEADLEQIIEYIAHDSPKRAVSFARELRRRCEDLATSAEAYPFLLRYRHEGVRRRVHGNYLIFYVVRADEVHVLHVLHGARDYEAILSPES